MRRRTFLRGLGAGLLGLPVLGSIGSTARASTGFPTRVIFVAQGQGSLMDQLVVPGTGPTDFSFGPILQALTPFRERIALIGGIDDATNILDGNYNGHTRCLHHTWSCKSMTWSGSANGSYPSSSGGTTIDQLIASRISSDRPWTSLEFGVEASSNLMLSHFWKAPGQPLQPENSPDRMFTRLFQDLVAADPEELARRDRRRELVLQAVKAQTDQLYGRVSAADRTRLDIHLSSIEAVEQTIGQVGLGESCEPPSTDLGDSSIPGRARAQVDLLTMALACDSTRVASLTLGDHQDWSWRGIDFPGGWHDAVHAGPATPERQDALIQSFSWYAEQLAYLLARLDATPEGDGSLLDNTLVVVGNIFSTGAAHSHEGKTYLLAGGGAGLVGGQNLDFGGATNGDLFTTILQALGFEDTFFGERDFCTGPLAGVFA